MRFAAFLVLFAWACDDAGGSSSDVGGHDGSDGTDDASFDASADAATDAIVPVFDTCFDNIAPTTEEDILFVRTWVSEDGKTSVRAGLERQMCVFGFTVAYSIVRVALRTEDGEECITDKSDLDYTVTHHNWNDHFEATGAHDYSVVFTTGFEPELHTDYTLSVDEGDPIVITVDGEYSIPTEETCL